jgi:hypothetical protein
MFIENIQVLVFGYYFNIKKKNKNIEDKNIENKNLFD